MLRALALVLLLPIEGEAIKLKTGDDAPAFSLPGSNGKTLRLQEFKGRKIIVLAFYPKSFSGGCTKEMTALRDIHPQLTAAGAQVLGISLDPLDMQVRFAESLKLPFPILSDREGKVASSYGVKGALWANRTTFVIDEAGKIASVIEGKDAVEPSITLAAVKRVKGAAAPKTK